MKKTLTLLFTVLFILVSLGFAQVQKPSDLKFPPLTYEPPDPKDFRTEFANGLRGYIQEDHSLPLFNISAIINFGGLYVPKDKLGLDSVMSETLIKGGTKTREGSDIEDRINFIGGSLNFRTSEWGSTLSLSVLSEDIDEGLELFFDVLMNPEFREGPLNLARASLIQRLRQANDQASGVLSREYERLLYGDHPLTWEPTQATYEGITSADLKAIHAQYFFPKNIILAVSGDFKEADLKAKINKMVSGWKNKRLNIPSFSKKFPQPEPGVYFIQMRTNQGYISIGHLGLEEKNPDYFAVQVMNFILGGGSFTSRITMKVRSDEGLSYNQGSRFRYRWEFPGTFSGYVQTKSSTVGYAISLILAEFNRIREEPVSNAEMDTAINYYLESFSNSFQSPQSTMSTFANLEMTGRPMNYYKTYRDKIKAVTKVRVQEVANNYIHPDKAVIMIVGDFEPCNKGGDKWPGPIDKLGKVHTINLKNPLTGEELK
ncbi:MAG: insulinase family protein [Candidatus Aminicenantes bacterium]|nr:MAG: insulinase family protein [Candidatus Aminicenantes bacterium]